MDQLGRKVGFRYLKAKKSTSFLSVITAISVGGVAVGVLAMVVILSVMSGFENEMKQRLFQADTHVRIERQDGIFKRSATLVGEINGTSPSIKGVYPVLQTEVILKSGNRISGAVLKGAGPDQMTRMKGYVSEWASSPFLTTGDPRLLIGQELAFELGVIPGELITVVSPVETEGPFGLAPRVKKFVVEGVYKSGVPEQELHDVFAKVEDVESFLREENGLSHVEVIVDRLESAPEVAALISKKLGPDFLVRSWQDLNAHLFASLKLERTAMFCMLAFIVIVASFNIVSMLTMTVIEKKRSLSILRAMGATRKQIGNIVLWQAAAIGLVGSFMGATLGLAICFGLKKYPLIELPSFYYDRTLPVLIHPEVIALVIMTTLLIVLVGAYLPARRASLMTPLAGIRG